MRIASFPCAVLCVPLWGAPSGCSFVYDADDVVLDVDPDVGVPGDGGADASPWDAAPSDFAVEAIEPASVFEGQGSAGAPIPVVFRGELLSGDLDIEASDSLVTIDSVVVGESGALAAAAIRVSVDDELGPNDAAQIELTITRNGEESDTVDLEVAGLDELVLDEPKEVSSSTFDELYSTIDIDGAALTGPAAARLVATSSITLSQKLDASGGQNARIEPGAGSCAGGEGGSSLGETEGDPGSCAGGGGAGTSDGSGGGGAGHIEGGSKGDGSGAGDGGDEHGNKMITPLGGEGGLGSGGGGGHAGTLESGGDGGGGGGVLELQSWGDVAINDTVDADGAEGGPGGCGGGGGGSGGALLVRAGGSLRAAGGTLSAAGGAGGAGDSSCEGGGDAADGRIRIDATSLSPPGDLDVQPDPIRGPMWREEPPVIVRNSTVTLEFVAERGFSYRAAVGGDVSEDVGEPGTTGSGEIAVELEEGLNEVCLRIPQDFEQGERESENCRSVAYVP